MMVAQVAVEVCTTHVLMNLQKNLYTVKKRMEPILHLMVLARRQAMIALRALEPSHCLLNLLIKLSKPGRQVLRMEN